MKMYRIIEVRNHPFPDLKIGIDSTLNLLLIEGNDAIKRNRDLISLIQALDLKELDMLTKAVIEAREKFNN